MVSGDAPSVTESKSLFLSIHYDIERIPVCDFYYIGLKLMTKVRENLYFDITYPDIKD